MRNSRILVPALVVLILLALAPSDRAWPADYFVKEGDPPTGGRILEPDGAWGTGPGYGPTSGWAFDDQAVALGNQGWYPLMFYAQMNPEFVDRDELWAREGCNEWLSDPYLFDLERASPSAFSWTCYSWIPGYGTFDYPDNILTLFRPQYLHGGEAVVNLWIHDLPLPGYYDDSPALATGDPYLWQVEVFGSHLGRDEANQDWLNFYPDPKPSNCQIAAQHAYDGNKTPGEPVVCPWGEYASHTWLFDSEGLLATSNPKDIVFTSVMRHNVVVYLKKWKIPPPGQPLDYTAIHIETISENGVDKTWGTNTARSTPSVWWTHSEVTKYVRDFMTTYGNQFEFRVRHYF